MCPDFTNGTSLSRETTKVHRQENFLVIQLLSGGTPILSSRSLSPEFTLLTTSYTASQDGADYLSPPI